MDGSLPRLHANEARHGRRPARRDRLGRRPVRAEPRADARVDHGTDRRGRHRRGDPRRRPARGRDGEPQRHLARGRLTRAAAAGRAAARSADGRFAPRRHSSRVSATNHTPRWIALDGAVNARAVVPGVRRRADNRQSLSASDVRVLVDEHTLEVVIDLRTDVEAEFEGSGPMSAERGVRIELRSLYPDSEGDTNLIAGAVKPWDARYEDESPQELPVIQAYLGYLR